MIACDENVSLEFEKIKKYIFDNNITELYDSVKIIQKNIDEKFEFPILDAIDLCLEVMGKAEYYDQRISVINILKKYRSSIIGSKYDYIKNCKIENIK